MTATSDRLRKSKIFEYSNNSEHEFLYRRTPQGALPCNSIHEIKSALYAALAKWPVITRIARPAPTNSCMFFVLYPTFFTLLFVHKRLQKGWVDTKLCAFYARTSAELSHFILSLTQIFPTRSSSHSNETVHNYKQKE